MDTPRIRKANKAKRVKTGERKISFTKADIERYKKLKKKYGSR